jgi:hypothetical protein
MVMRILLSLAVLGLVVGSMDACCPVGRSGKPIVNADQTVIIVWDAEKKQQHFIRKASFAAADKDFGFIIPSPTEPNLGKSGEEAFNYLKLITSPQVIKRSMPSGGCGCGDTRTATFSAVSPPTVTVLQEKEVAGFQAVVLEAKDSTSFTKWLADHGYAYSADIAAWAQPYIDQKWKFTALKVSAKKPEATSKLVEATALRLSFQTDRPLFPYREPASTEFAKELKQQNRLLRIYFVADKQYSGEITREKPWSGQVAWARGLTQAERDTVIKHLSLPTATPSQLYLTEFEDRWPYAQAAGDVCFAASARQETVQRQPIIEYVADFPVGDASTMALAGIGLVSYLAYRGSRHRRQRDLA